MKPITLLLAFLPAGLALAGEPGKPVLGYTDTPILPNSTWHVHDPARPAPPVVSPGNPGAPGRADNVPSDAIRLFDGTDLSKWRTADNNPAPWKVADGVLTVSHGPDGKSADIFTREEFGDCQLHVEFATPDPAKGDSQGRGNSGIFLMSRYEFQVLDSFQNPTYADGGAGSLYGQWPPLVNASRPPGTWQTYDIIFTAPRFDGEKLVSPAIVTALHNGVLVQNHRAYLGPTRHKTFPQYKSHPALMPLKLQDHGDPVRYRNLWIRRLDSTTNP